MLILIPICGYYIYNFIAYRDWHKEEIPTNTELKGTIKIPDEWKFCLNGNIVSIKDGDGNIIATEIFQGKRTFDENDNWDSMHFNTVEGFDLSNKDNYNFKSAPGSGAYIYSFETDSISKYCLELPIYDELYTDWEYQLFMIFIYDVDYDVVKKIAYSHEWGGFIEEKVN